MNEAEAFDRWIHCLRAKAQEFEHPARAQGRETLAPTLDALAWELESYVAGRGIEIAIRKERAA